MIKGKFRYGEDWYDITVTENDWYVHDVGDMPERMISAANEFALEHGMRNDSRPPESNSLCPTCREGTLVTVTKDYTLQSVARLGGKSLVVKNITREECYKCGEQIFPWPPCEKIDAAVALEAGGKL